MKKENKMSFYSNQSKNYDANQKNACCYGRFFILQIEITSVSLLSLFDICYINKITIKNEKTNFTISYYYNIYSL